MTDETALNTRHADKMRKKKAARDKIIAGKTIEKGLLIVHTGKGKGKSTAAFGMIFRCIGHGMRAGVIQSRSMRAAISSSPVVAAFARTWPSGPTMQEPPISSRPSSTPALATPITNRLFS